MSDSNGLKIVIKSGETNDSIVKKFSILNWAEVYHHPNNNKLRAKYKESDQIKPNETIWVPADNVLASQTGKNEGIKQPIWRFFFNAHMHIQSNNCCPMPLEWGILTKVIHGIPVINLFAQERTYKSRKAMNEMVRGFIGSMTTGRLGKIGILSTDLVAGVYMGDLKNENMREEMVWSVMDEEEFNALKDKKGDNTALEKAGKKAKIQSLGAETDAAFKDSFYAPTEYYYHNAPLTMFNCALLMDMSLAHYWGQWHIPVTLDWGTQAVYINDWCAAYVLKSVDEELDNVWEYPERVDPDVIEPKGNNYYYSHIFAKATRDKDFSLKKALEKYHLHQNKKSDSSRIITNVKLAFRTPDQDEKLCNKEFVHIVDRIPDGTASNIAEGEKPNELKWFEDYKLQKKLSEGAAVKYPLEFFLFYHYDPRRHCGGVDTAAYASDKAQEIIANHAFYRYQQSSNPGPNEPTFMVPDEKMNKPSFWKSLLEQTIISNKDAFNSLHFINQKDGIYWGVKTYPRLGYDPSDFVKYPQLEALYQQCGKDVPLLTHCSRGGLGGADYYSYAKYDPAPSGLIGNHKARYDELTADPSNLDHTEFWYADSFAAPGNWEKVLNQFPGLRLCFAHFGGYDTWCQVGVFEDIMALYPENPGIFPKGEEIESGAPLMQKADEKEKMRATLYYTWIKKIAELAETKENVYTDLSYFHLGKDIEASDVRLEKRPTDLTLLVPESDHPMVDCKKLIAKNIVYLLDKFKNLKNKIIIGTDWYMIEREHQKGVGDILRNLFIVMEMVSEKVGYDAWHQFAVINPMRYLGVGKEEGGKMVIESEKLKGYREVLLKRIKDAKWKVESRTEKTLSEAPNKIQLMMQRISNFPNVPLKM